MKMKTSALLALPLLLALTVTGCSSAKPISADQAAANKTEAVETAEEAPAEVGTRNSPGPIGTPVEIADVSGNPNYTVVIGAVNLDANAAIAAENQFNAPPTPGNQYILVPVTITYVGTTTGAPAYEVDVAFVSAAGTTHSTFDASVVAPTPLNSVNELYPGAVATGNVAILVPSADIAAGALTVGTLFGGEKTFVALA
jgi:hypothetical protein